MKNRILSKSLLTLLVCSSLLSCRQKPYDPSVVRSSRYSKSIKEAYSTLGIFQLSTQIPGMTVAVSIDNQIVWADGFGYSNYELKAKASPSHLFRIGQISELITALTAVKLYEEGKLPIDKPVREFLPEMSPKPDDFTIRQLGAHSAGIRTENVPAGHGNANSLETIVASFINDNLDFKPGYDFSHTELGFDLIGYLIEKSNKEAFAKVVKRTLTDTLKLSATIQDVPLRITENKSSNYDYNFVAQPIVANPIDLRGKEASAGYLSSVIDLVKIGNTLLYPGFLKQESIDLLTTPFKLKSGQASLYSFGLIVSKDNKGQTFYGQTGFLQGGSATLLIYPDDKLVVAIACNIKCNSSELPVFEIAEVFKKQLHPELAQKEQKSDNADTTSVK